MKCFGALVLAYPLGHLAPSMPTAVVPDQKQLLGGVDLSELVEYLHRNEHVLPVGHEGMLFACLEGKKAVQAFTFLGGIGIYDRWVAVLGQPDLLECSTARQYHFVLAEDNRSLIMPGPHEPGASIGLLSNPGLLASLIGFFVAFAGEVEAQLGLTEQEVVTRLGSVAFPGECQYVPAQPVGRPMLLATTRHQVLWLPVLERKDNCLPFGRRKDPFTVASPFI